ncbi:phage major capsid protein [Kitasatospora purpeofusca]|uniref:phage major capsid protein n=1 Tax=Kitasatospora purpeofusca TaxID=67352 RepID=UPI002E0EF1BA|nr:phage major capsid protein [Kitasatospora purpeofusca]WSR43255.1 phage major capsid protein [Kitasatospora purpeofusca]
MTADKNRLKELHAALRAKAAELDGISNAFTVEENGVTVSPEKAAAFRKTLGEAQAIKQMITDLEGAAGIETFLNEPATHPYAPHDAALAARLGAGPAKGLGQRFLDSEEFKALKAAGFRGSFDEMVTVDGHALDQLASKDVFSRSAGTAAVLGLGVPERLDIIPRAVRPGRIRDLFPSQTTTANQLYGVRVTGFTNAAAIVPERAMEVPPGGGAAVEVYARAGQSNLTFKTVTYPVAEVAHTMPVHKNTLADEPRLRDLIDIEMIDGVKMVEDNEILYGVGGDEKITGIVNTQGVQTYAQVDPDKQSAAIRRAATRAVLAYFPPTGIVLHPFDFEDLELETDGQGAYRVAVNVAIGAQKVVWRLAVVDSMAINEGKFLIGSFGLGARLYDREQVSVQVSTENRDNFERGVVTLRGSERIGLEIPRPESFVYGSFKVAP